MSGRAPTYSEFSSAISGAAFENLDRKTLNEIFTIYCWALPREPRDAADLWALLKAAWRNGDNCRNLPWDRGDVDEAWHRFTRGREAVVNPIVGDNDAVPF